MDGESRWGFDRRTMGQNGWIHKDTVHGIRWFITGMTKGNTVLGVLMGPAGRA